MARKVLKKLEIYAVDETAEVIVDDGDTPEVCVLGPSDKFPHNPDKQLFILSIENSYIGRWDIPISENVVKALLEDDS